MIKNRRLRYYTGAAYHLIAVFALVELWRRTGSALPLIAAVLLFAGTVVAIVLLRRDLMAPPAERRPAGSVRARLP